MLTTTTPSSPRSAAPGGPRTSVMPGSGRRGSALGPRSRRLGIAFSALLVAVLLVGGGTGFQRDAAAAAPAPAAAPAAAPTSSPTPTDEPAQAPTIQVGNSDSGRTTARGTGQPGASLRVLDPEHPASSLCTPTVSASGSWSCGVTVPSEPKQTLTVRDIDHSTLPDVVSPTFSVLAPPVLAAPSGVAVGAKVGGTAYPGARVTATLTNRSTGATARVASVAGASGAWQALLPASSVPTGTYLVTARQSSARIPDVPLSATSSAISITIDRQAPPAPRIDSPAAGSTVSTQPLVFSGRGENGDTVTTYVDSNPVCTAVVSSGRWSCSSTGLLIPAGVRGIQAAQRDAAGNYGAPTAATRVTFAAAPTSTPTATGGPTAPGSPDSDQPGTASPSPGVTASPEAGAGGPVPGGPDDSDGSSGSGGGAGGSGSGGTGTGQPPSAGSPATGDGTGGGSSAAAASSWTASTDFGQTLPSVGQVLGTGSWAFALALGLLFVLLVIAPLRLAASALGGRIAFRARHLTGRNRGRPDESPALSPAVAGALALAVGAVLVALSAGVDDQLRSVRLVLAIVIGLGVINGIGIILPTWIAGRRLDLTASFRVSPRLLAVAALACVATRLFGIDPPVVLGVLVVAGLADGSGRDLDEAGDVRRGGVLALVQLASLSLVAFAAWLGHGLLPAGGTVFAVELTREVLATVCLAGAGSVILLLVPVGRLPGRALYSWSRPTLAGLAIVGAAVAAVVYAGDSAEAFPVVPLLVVSVAFAVVASSTWVWVTYVEPTADAP